MAEERGSSYKPYLQDSSSTGDSSSEDVSSTDLRVQETHILQERKIGVFGAISLIVNKIIGAGITGYGATTDRASNWNIETSASNAITASSYLLKAADADSTTWKLRGLAIAAVGFAVGVHSITPRIGRGLQDILSAVKLFTLFFIVCTGFAALGGHVKGAKPHNFDISTSFEGTSNNGYNIGTALLNAIFSFQGYDNMNAVLSEVKNPQRTLRIALPTAMGTVTVLYILANIAYRYLTARVLQELAKDGITPFPNLLMQNRPFKTPIACLAIHLAITIIFICAPPAGDAFNFVVGLGTYPTVFLLTLVTIGLIKLRLDKNDKFQSSFKVPWAILAFYLAGNIGQFLLVMPFVPPVNGKGSTSLPYWLSPVVSLAILALGVIYYVGRFILLPWAFGYELDLVAVGLSDGSRVSRYKVRKV
ncbi:High-affinity methionine permease [Penicillium subrubescens]|uniref:High-affinity methionine permease n=1 Tax=Penicillium subrubescens TaxID=1316194 RepID=A0A1Q5SZB9_9EURO|nr:High-affinity methionine permease [Penicillium subrubescens]